MVSSQNDLDLQKLLVRTFFIQAFFDHGQVLLLDAKDTGVCYRAAYLFADAFLPLGFLLLRFEQNVFANSPTEVEELTDLPSWVLSAGEATFSKQHNVKRVLIEIWAIQSLTFGEVHYGAVLQNKLYRFDSQFAEYWVEIL